jgi:HJR/Mrr/RecB family endonuclease
MRAQRTARRFVRRRLTNGSSSVLLTSTTSARRSQQDGPTILPSPKDAAQIRLALMMALDRANDVEFEQMVRAAYQALHIWATARAASNAEGGQ